MSGDAKRLTASDVRRDFSNLVSRAAYTGEHYVICRGRQELAAIISMDEYHQFLELKQKSEDEGNAAHAS
ncbi:MAG: type II toxin-antitoxin system Phd/YefM family antitoxin [Rubrobacter sp.]|nr:type II toxin-antitoxin system Phd/YefM family antitoxin [Rubrobacter sp.]